MRFAGKKYWLITNPFMYGKTEDGQETESKYEFELFDLEVDWINRINEIKGDGWYESPINEN